MGKLVEGALRALDWLVEKTAKIAGYFAMALVAWTTFAVVMRYVFDKPLMIANDAGKIAAVFVFFLAVAFGLKNQVHPTISFFTNRLSPRWQQFIQMLDLLLYIGMGILWTALFWSDMVKVIGYKATVELMPYIPIGWVRVPMVVGMGTFTLICIAYFGFTLRDFIKNRPMNYSPPLTLKEPQKQGRVEAGV